MGKLPFGNAAAASYPYQLVSWLNATGVYKVTEEAYYSFSPIIIPLTSVGQPNHRFQTLEHALNLNPSNTRDVIMYVSSGFSNKYNARGKHYIVLLSPITYDRDKDIVTVKYWS